MRVSVQKMLVGLLATTFVACGAAAMAAHGGGGPHGGGGHYAYYGGYHYHHGYYPGIYYRGVRPVVVAGVYPAAVYTAPVLSVRLRNPAENRVTLSYILDGGPVQRLAAGQSVDLAADTVLEFDRGGNAGSAAFTLSDGSYRFTPGAGFGGWCADPDPTAVASVAEAVNPAPGE